MKLLALYIPQFYKKASIVQILCQLRNSIPVLWSHVQRSQSPRESI